MNIKPSPCKPECERRSATCHADCQDYANWKDAEDAAKAQIEVKKRVESDLESWRRENIVATRKYGRKR